MTKESVVVRWRALPKREGLEHLHGRAIPDLNPPFSAEKRQGQILDPFAIKNAESL